MHDATSRQPAGLITILQNRRILSLVQPFQSHCAACNLRPERHMAIFLSISPFPSPSLRLPSAASLQQLFPPPRSSSTLADGFAACRGWCAPERPWPPGATDSLVWKVFQCLSPSPAMMAFAGLGSRQNAATSAATCAVTCAVILHPPGCARPRRVVRLRSTGTSVTDCWAYQGWCARRVHAPGGHGPPY